MTQQTITMTDVRASGLCARGAKTWFQSHGLDFRKFLREGMPLDEVAKLDDGLSNRVVQYVRKTRGGEE